MLPIEQKMRNITDRHERPSMSGTCYVTMCHLSATSPLSAGLAFSGPSAAIWHPVIPQSSTYPDGIRNAFYPVSASTAAKIPIR